MKSPSHKQRNLLLSFIIGSLLFAPLVSLAASPAQARNNANRVCWAPSKADTYGTIRCFPDLGVCQNDVKAVYGELKLTGDARWAKITPANMIGVCTEYDKTGFMGYVDVVKEKAVEVGKDLLDSTVGWVLEQIAWFVFQIAGAFLTSMGAILDYGLMQTVQSTYLGSLDVVNVGWKVVRDFSNLFFIFILLYIAISTILNLNSSNTKRLLAGVILSAVFINFSLFFTKVVIDAGNVVAFGFWQQIKETHGSKTVYSSSDRLLGGGKLQTVLDPKSSANQKIATTYTQRAMMYAGGAVLMFIMGYIFLYGTILLAVRAVVLMMLMITSPFAFLGIAMPKFSVFHKWFDNLINQTLVAPVLIIMLYLNSVLIENNDLTKLSGAGNDSLACAVSGNCSTGYLILFHYIILVALLILSLHITQSFAGSMAGKASGWTKKIIGVGGGALVGSAAYAGRQVVGRGGQALGKNEQVQEWAKRKGALGYASRLALRGGNVAQNATFDARNSKMFNATAGAALGTTGIALGKAGGDGGYKKTGDLRSKITLGKAGYVGTEAQEAKIKTAKEVYKYNPQAQEQYLRANLGTEKSKDGSVKSAYDGVALSEERARISQEQAVSSAKEKVGKQTEILNSAAAGSEEARKADIELRGALATLGKTGITKVKEEWLKDAQVISRMSGEQITEVENYTNSNKGKEGLTDAITSHIRNNIQDGGKITASAREAIRKAQPNSSLYFDFAHEFSQTAPQNKEKWINLAGGANVAQFDRGTLMGLASSGMLPKEALVAIEKRNQEGVYEQDFIPALAQQMQQTYQQNEQAYLASGNIADIKNMTLHHAYTHLEKIQESANKSDSPYYGAIERIPLPKGKTKNASAQTTPATAGNPPPTSTPAPTLPPSPPPPPGYQQNPGGRIIVPNP